MPGTVLITGASSGIGLETAAFLASRGFRVMAGLRDPRKSAELDEAARKTRTKIDKVAIDVTDTGSIAAGIAQTITQFGNLDALVNNAGIQIRGFFEDTSDAEFRRVFETNLFGAVAMTRAVLPHMRAAGRGRIVLISSVGGRLGAPGLSAYCASKFAIEGFAESLAIEVNPFHIAVSLIEPGIVRTPIWNRNMIYAENAKSASSPYAHSFAELEQLASNAVKRATICPEDVARAIHHAISAPRPRRRYLIGSRPRALVFFRRLLPPEFFERTYGKLINRKLARPS